MGHKGTLSLRYCNPSRTWFPLLQTIGMTWQTQHEEIEKRKLLRRFVLVSWGVFLAVLTWLLAPKIDRMMSNRTAKPRPVMARGELAADEISTIQVFEQASPSVVFISTSERVVDYWSRNVMDVPRGNGSGFIWDSQGHIVTNHHVISGASKATVRLNDGRSFDAGVVGTSPDHDLAVLRIDVGLAPPPPVPVGTSGDLRVGQKVFAIGNPFGLDYTLTSGLVSALNRTLDEENGARIEGLIQTDAAINPGNSGGPLLDSAGRLIGINTAIYSPSGAYAGIGFAVPVDTVNQVVPQLIARGKFIRPTIGISVDEEVNKAISRRLGIQGVLVLGTTPGSAAERAGIQPSRMTRRGGFVPGDVILSINGEAISSVKDLGAILSKHKVGDRVIIRLLRGNHEVEASLTLQAGSS
jgi:S1-C subfamily serine protease